jgi:hypothetical protein
MKILERAVPVLAGVIAGALLVGFALPAFGDNESPERAAADASTLHLSRAKGFISKSSGLKVRYLAGQATVQPNAENGVTLKCPKKTPHAISSFFGPAAKEGVGQIVLSDSLPDGASNRSWDIGVKNLSATPQTFVGGVVCIK